MQTIAMILVAFVRKFVLSRATLQLENIALHQQVAVLKRERPRPQGTLSGIFDVALILGMVFAAVNSLIHGYTGFGSALLTVPLLTFLFGPVEAIAMVGVMTICGTAQLYPRTVRQELWQELLPIFAGIATVMPLGA